MDKHTPAPWSVSWSTFNEGENHGIYASGEMDLKGHQIAIVNFYPTLDSKADEETGKANARLIAAAPELLDALEQCLARIDKNSGSTWDKKAYLVAESLIKKIRG